MIRRFSFDKLVQRTGGWSLIILVAIAQILSLLGTIPGMLSIRINAEFEEGPLETFSEIVPLLILIIGGLLLALTWRITTAARKQLDDYAAQVMSAKPEDEFRAWSEITT